MPVPQAQKRHGSKVRARGFAADEEAVTAEAPLRLPQQPQGGRLAVIGRGRVRVFGREPVIHRHDRQAAAIGETIEPRVLLVGRAPGPAAAMDVQDRHPWDCAGAMIRSGMGPAGPLDLDRPSPARSAAWAGKVRGPAGGVPWMTAGGTDEGSGKLASLARIAAFWARISSLTAAGSNKVGSIMRDSGCCVHRRPLR